MPERQKKDHDVKNRNWKGLWNNLLNMCMLERVEGMYKAVD